MEKKTKILVAAAAGALAVGIALSVASCALRSVGTEQQALQEETPVEEVQQDQGQSSKTSATLTSYELACSKGWKSDAGTLQMSKGMVIEKGSDGKIHVLTVSEVKEADAGKQAVFTISGTDEDAQAAVTWTLIFDQSSGVATLSSDDFKVSKSYAENVTEDSVSVSGIDEAYLGLVGGDVEPLRKVLASYMAKNVPQAASATFDGEAFVDFNDKTVSATFHADDAAKTILTVTYANGKFTVSG